MTLLEFLQTNERFPVRPDPEQSVDLAKITHGSHKRLWWQCDKGHRYEAPVFAVASGSWPCPQCSGRKAIPGETDLESLHPEVVKQWDYEKNELSPSQLRPGSRELVWWKCDHGHSWQARVYSVVRGDWPCPYCSGHRAIPGETDLATLHPELAAKWDGEKNGTLTPADVRPGSHKRVWWKCDEGHSYEAPVYALTSGIWGGCPYCSGRKAIAGKTDLATLYPELVKEWDWEKNGDLTPSQVRPGSRTGVWWKCELGHSWQAIPHSRTKEKGTGCPYCAGRKVLAGFNDLATLRPKLAAEWYHPLNGDLTPEQVTPGSNLKVWWKCDNRHVWKAAINSRAKKKGTGCPVCAGVAKARKIHYFEVEPAKRPALKETLKTNDRASVG